MKQGRGESIMAAIECTRRNPTLAPSSHHKIRINISGRVVETTHQLLDRYPQTLLGNAQTRIQFWDPIRKEYFIDAHMPTFEAIFQFYQTGRLRRPLEVPIDTFLDQVKYFRMDSAVISAFKEKEGILLQEEEMLLPDSGIRRSLWKLSEYPSSSVWARRLALFSVGFILLSIILLCIETLPDYKGTECIRTIVLTSHGIRQKYRPNFLSEYFILETVCVVWFSFEVSIRFYSSPTRSKFFLSVLNVIDLLTILPYFVTLMIMLFHNNCSVGRMSAAISSMRILRIFRIFKLTKHSQTLQIWSAALKASKDEFVLFLFYLCTSSVLFGGVIYHIELGDPASQIRHIPDGIWWAVITMTTVGYGDIVPVTHLGKTVGTLCVLMGILSLALPTPVIINNFNKFYKNATGRGYEMDIENEKKR